MSLYLHVGPLTAGGELNYHTEEESHRGASPQRVDLKENATDINIKETYKAVSSLCDNGCC